MKSRLHIFAVVAAAVLCRAEMASAVDTPEHFLAQLRAKVDSAEKEKRTALAGAEGWLFFVPELRSLCVGPFWGENAVKVSRSSKSEYADPLPAIVDFHQQLKKAGVGLLVVPVPAKAAVYPERLDAAVDRPPTDTVRFDPYQRQFHDVLKEHGVIVLDLLPLFVEHRGDASAMYCRTDSHWSPAAVALAAEAITVEAKNQGWWQSGDKSRYETENQQLTVTGDLARMLNESQPDHETLTLTTVGERKASGLEPLTPDRASPLLLMGDSHTLVFHDPELFGRGAGLPDHLALRLGMPVDLLGVRGSGATTTRIELLRRRDNLQGKKLVVWCFSFREFTESFTGWRKVPVVR